MRLTTAGRYALRAIVDIALHSGEGPVLRKEIAARQEISLQYLSKLLRKLKQAGLVDSVMGPGGGYVLTRDAAQIKAIDVLRGVEETVTPVFCVEAGQEVTCPRVDGCPTHWLWIRLNQAIFDVLDAVTVAELCDHAVV
jgi:Rrf2 family iron-sulfur cluster assembly transcriptional regulator